MWSQVPIIATRQLGLQQHMAEKGTALLFAFVGMGAVFGVLVMPGLQKRYKIDPVVNACTACFACGLMLLSIVHHLWLAGFIMVFLGINWVIIPTNFNTATQTSVPPWVKGRAISFYLTVLFGSFTVGALLWGNVTTATSIHTALLAGGASMLLLLLLAPIFPLTLNEGLDLTPALKPGQSLSETEAVLPAGLDDLTLPANQPVEVAVHYTIDPSKRSEFLPLLREMAGHRKRNGAGEWRFIATGDGEFIETFRFASVSELTRQAGRMTVADLALHGRLRGYHAGPAAPAIRVSAATGSSTAQQGWLAEQVLIWLERALDESIIGIARVRGRPDRIPTRRA
jgi:hypothetical protein